MAIEYEIDSEAGLLHATARGALDDRQIREYVESFLAHPHYKPGLAGLVDLRSVTDVSGITPEGVRALASITRGREAELAGSRLAMVASEAVVFGLARMYELLRDPPYEIQVFQEMESAREWLGL